MQNYGLILAGKTDESVFETDGFGLKVGERYGSLFEDGFHLGGVEERVSLERIANDGGMVARLGEGDVGASVGDGGGVAFEAVHQRVDRLLSEDLAIVHDDAVVDEALHVLNDMRCEEHRLVFGASIVAKIVDEKSAIAGVETEREVVEDKELGVLGEDEAEGDLRPLTVRHTGNTLSGGNLKFLHQIVICFLLPLAGVESGIEAFDLLNVHKLVLYVPFEQEADVSAQSGVHRSDVLAEDAARARMRLEIAAEDVDSGSLAGTVLSEQPENASLRDFEAQVLVNFTFSVIVCKIFTLNYSTHTYR